MRHGEVRSKKKKVEYFDEVAWVQLVKPNKRAALAKESHWVLDEEENSNFPMLARYISFSKPSEDFHAPMYLE